jgi:uncharacterized protein
MEQRREGTSKGTASRGFASMDKELQREIARKGGQAVSQNRQHMAEIGRKGGEHSGINRGNRANQMNQQSQGNRNPMPMEGDNLEG